MPDHTIREARVSPDGYVAQLWPVPHPDGQRWLLTEPEDDSRATVTVRLLHDEDVADWPVCLGPIRSEPATHRDSPT